MAKSNILQPALNWFKEKYPSIEEPVIASKFHSSSESWSNSRVWFFQIPRDVIEPNKIKYIHMVCQNHLNGEPFFYFRVPTLFLLRNEASFEMDRAQKFLKLYLSAEAVDMFREIRKGSNIDFTNYLQQTN